MTILIMPKKIYVCFRFPDPTKVFAPTLNSLWIVGKILSNWPENVLKNAISNKIFRQIKMCRPSIPSFFKAETWNTHIYLFWPYSYWTSPNFYFRALKDAEKAISLAKTWAKGFFRQGRALAGLKVSGIVVVFIADKIGSCGNAHFWANIKNIFVSPCPAVSKRKVSIS